MSSFRYRASTAEGRIVEGQVEAPSQKGAMDELRRQRLYPFELAPVVSADGARRSRGGKAEAIALFARTVATMLSAGVALDRAIGFAADQAGHDELRKAARQANEDVRGGASFAEAIGRHPSVFGSLFVAMVAAGEESGALDEAMARVADHLDEQVELRAQIRASLMYPALMAIASGAGIAVLLLFVIPRFVSILEGESTALPFATRLLLGLSQVLVNGWWILLILAAACAIGTRWWLEQPRNRQRWHAWRLALPLTGELERNYSTARFTRALGLLLKSGRPILPSLRVARGAVTNLELGAALDRATEAVSHGKRVSTALTGTLPPLAAELIAVGEESGRLDELSLQVATAYDAQVRRSLRSAVAVIEPALILLFGLIVGFVALAMLQAIYSINQNVL